MADIEKILSKAFGYSLDIKKMGMYFLVSFAMLIAFFISMEMILSAGAISITTIVYPVLIIGLASLIFFFGSIYIDAIITHNSIEYGKNKRVSLSTSSETAKNRYLSALAAVIIVSLISFFVSFIFAFIPLGTFAVGLILGLAFMLFMPSVVSGNGPIESLKESYHLFMENKMTVFVVLILMTFIASIMFLIALVPFFVAIMPVALSLIQLISSGDVTNMIGFLVFAKANMPVVFVGMIISAILMAYVQVYQTAVKAFLYSEIKHDKRKNN